MRSQDIVSSFYVTIVKGDREELEAAYQSLVGDLNGPPSAARTLALGAILRNPPPFLEDTILALADDPETAGASIAGLQKLATPRAKAKLAELSEPGNPEYIRQPAVQALGELGDPAYCPLMLNIAEESDQYSRYIALRAAGYLCGPTVIPVARRFLEQSDPSARFEAAYALGNSASPRAIPILVALLRDADPNVRRAASDALATLTHRKATFRVRDTTEARQSFEQWMGWWRSGQGDAKVYRIDQCAPATPLR